jgi:hypothetical protein
MPSPISRISDICPVAFFFPMAFFMPMNILLANSFHSSLDKLNAEEQKAARLPAFKLQINPSNPGLQFHRLDNIKTRTPVLSAPAVTSG